MKCPSCGQDVAWTLAKPVQEKLACTNMVGERNNMKKCGFEMKRCEWDYIREKPESRQTVLFIEKKLAAFTKRKAGR